MNQPRRMRLWPLWIVIGAAILTAAYLLLTPSPTAPTGKKAVSTWTEGSGSDRPLAYSVAAPAYTRAPSRATRSRFGHAGHAARRSRVALTRTDSAQAWALWPSTLAVVKCESGNDGSAVSRTAKYQGFYQMDSDFWRTYGGLRYASSPARASRFDQNEVAYRGWQARGWQPWTCARIVGLI